MDIRVSGRKVRVTEALKNYAEDKIGNALKVFDIQPMDCDVVLRVDKNKSNPDSKYVEVTVFVRDSVVRVETSDADMYAAIDEAATKVSRALRKYKTRVVDKRQRPRYHAVPESTPEDLDALMDEIAQSEDDDLLVREKVVDLQPMTLDEALVEIDLIGHDFYVYTDAETGLTNVVYRRKNGGYGVIKPAIEEHDGNE